MVATRIAAPHGAVKSRASKAGKATPAAKLPRRPKAAPAAKVGATPNPPPVEPPSAAPAPLAQLTRADLLDLRTQVEDITAAALDQLRPLRRRRLGRLTARRTIIEAYRKASQILDGAALDPAQPERAS